jgi:hypothetical protein
LWHPGTRAPGIGPESAGRARIDSWRAAGDSATDYVNTIPVSDEPPFAGDEEMERRFRRLVRWNAAMMVRAQRPEIARPNGVMGIAPMNAICRRSSTATCETAGLRTPRPARLGVPRRRRDGRAEVAGHAADGSQRRPLTLMINCNMQRLDGPVRGNGEIIQELEAFFRGAGWRCCEGGSGMACWPATPPATWSGS